MIFFKLLLFSGFGWLSIVLIFYFVFFASRSFRDTYLLPKSQVACPAVASASDFRPLTSDFSSMSHLQSNKTTHLVFCHCFCNGYKIGSYSPLAPFGTRTCSRVAGNMSHGRFGSLTSDLLLNLFVKFNCVCVCVCVQPCWFPHFPFLLSLFVKMII